MDDSFSTFCSENMSWAQSLMPELVISVYDHPTIRSGCLFYYTDQGLTRFYFPAVNEPLTWAYGRCWLAFHVFLKKFRFSTFHKLYVCWKFLIYKYGFIYVSVKYVEPSTLTYKKIIIHIIKSYFTGFKFSYTITVVLICQTFNSDSSKF